MNKSILAMAVASLFSHAQYSHAQEVSIDETMVVTANRFEQSQSSTLAPISVVTRDEIETYQANSITEVLRRLPGVEIAQNGGRGQNASIFLRGTNSDHVLVLIDGVRISSSAGGVAINHIPVGLVERLEVMRGPGAAIYGSDAIGGVINIITRSHRGNENKSIEVGSGSNGSKKASLAANTDVSDSGHFQIGAGFESTKGYDIKTPATNIDYGYENKNILVGYEHQLAPAWQGYISALWMESLTDYDSWGLTHGFSENISLTGQLDYKKDDYQSKFSLNYQQTEKTDYSQSEGYENASTKAEIELTQLQWANLYQLNDIFTLGAGADGRREKLKDGAKNYGNPHVLAGESRDTVGIYGTALATYEKLTLEANVRFDEHDEYDDYTTWSVAGGYQLDQSHRVTMSYGTAFKAPTYSDLTTTPNLKPEESENLELGLSGYYSFAQWNLAIYDNQVDNLIIWYRDAANNWYSDNVNAQIKGIELDVSFDTGPLNHTLVAEYKDHKDDNDVQLARRAEENYKWIAFASFGAFDVSSTYTYTGKRLDLPSETPASDDYIPSTSLWDVSLGYWITDNVVVRARVDNLFDEEYETAKGYKAPERSYFVSTKIDF
ncbi:TonB-dependent receptor [Vibrio sp. FNV 38]|nr:TonB-dependent receptor [Vibrio sp. FNV 38]